MKDEPIDPVLSELDQFVETVKQCIAQLCATEENKAKEGPALAALQRWDERQRASLESASRPGGDRMPSWGLPVPTKAAVGLLAIDLIYPLPPYPMWGRFKVDIDGMGE